MTEKSHVWVGIVVIGRELIGNGVVFRELPAGLYIPLCKKGWGVRAVSSHSGSFT